MTSRRNVVASLALAAAACATIIPAPHSDVAFAEPADAWARVLERFVDDRGRVDFDALAADRRDLDRYVAWIYAIGPNNAPARFPTRAHVLAYHLNAYNALAMYSIVEDGVPSTLAGLKKLEFFVMRQLRVGAEPISLYAYENDVIRKLGEERVHFALNCMAAACPRLPRVPFPVDGLDAVLERETRAFLSEPRNVEIDPLRRVVRISELLSFYREDFLARTPSLVAYLNRYRDTPIPDDYRIEFIRYDWTVNRQPRRPASRSPTSDRRPTPPGRQHARGS